MKLKDNSSCHQKTECKLEIWHLAQWLLNWSLCECQNAGLECRLLLMIIFLLFCRHLNCSHDAWTVSRNLLSPLFFHWAVLCAYLLLFIHFIFSFWSGFKISGWRLADSDGTLRTGSAAGNATFPLEFPSLSPWCLDWFPLRMLSSLLDVNEGVGEV